MSDESIEEVLGKFGWKADDTVFWEKYHTDPWVYNLANALKTLAIENAHLRSVIEEEKRSHDGT